MNYQTLRKPRISVIGYADTCRTPLGALQAIAAAIATGLRRACNAVSRPVLIAAANEADLIRAVSAVNESIGSGDWLRVSPFGEWPNEVGLQVFDRTAAEAMTTAFNESAALGGATFKGLPIYEGHPDQPGWSQKNPGYKRLAVGRVKELQPRADGLYARVAFNERGNSLVRGDAAAYEAQSPHWGMRPTTYRGGKAFRPVVLFSLGLTNQPNIPGTQFALNEASSSPDMKKHIIALLAALGRPVANADTVSDDQLSAAVNEAVPVATAAITAVNEVSTLKPKLTTVETELGAAKQKLTVAEQSLQTAVNESATLKTQLVSAHTQRAEAVLETAINEGRITQAQRPEWLGKLTANGANFDTVHGELKKLTKAVNTKSKVADLGQRKAEAEASANVISAINEAVSKKEKDTGCSRAEAYAAVRREKPELFKNANE